MSRVWEGREVRAGGRVSRWGGPWRPAEHGEVRTTFLCTRPHLHALGSPSRRHRVCLCSAERVADAGGRQVPAGQPVMAMVGGPTTTESGGHLGLESGVCPAPSAGRRHVFLIAGGLAPAVQLQSGVSHVLVVTALTWKAVAMAYSLHMASPGMVTVPTGPSSFGDPALALPSG